VVTARQKLSGQWVTAAMMAFNANIRRSRAFLQIFDEPGGRPRLQGQPSNNEKELLRAAVVFAVAALDAYLHDLVLEVVPERGVHSPQMADALRAIAKDDPSLPLRVALAKDRTEAQAEFRAALDVWLSAKSFQGPDAVVRALGFVGHRTTVAQLEPAIGSGWAKQLADWTVMRHDIVHRAKMPYIRRIPAGECVELITKIAEAVDYLVLDE
jgi:hypothetical protein